MPYAIYFGNIPAELRSLPQWVNWRIEERDGKPTKVPKQPNGRNANTGDRGTWSTFDRVCQTNGQLAGKIGFVFAENGGYVGIDLDKCRNPKTGVTEQWALDIIKELDSYTELSQSGTGWHVIVKGKLPEAGNKAGSVEMYEKKRFFCTTGIIQNGFGRLTIEDRDISRLHARMMAREFVSEQKATTKSSSTSESEKDFRIIWELFKQLQSNDADVIEKAFQQKYPERYEERNHVKRKRGCKNYIRYSIEKFLERNPPESRARIGSMREDTSNAERFVRQHSEGVRFWHTRGAWLVWGDTHWQEDETDSVVELAKKTARSIYHEAAGLPEEAAAKMCRWAEQSLNNDKIAGMLKMAKSDPRIAITTDKLDADPWLLNFENGTIDLRSGELRAHRREDYITKLVRCKYPPDLAAPRWLLFVEQMFGDLAEWVQKAVGYSLTGSTREKVVFLLLGPPDTGKTTFLATLKTIFADYSSMLQIDTLMWSRARDSNVLADLADLRGARFVVTSETEEGQRLRESQLKFITKGMGEIKTKRLYENPITFPETHKLWIDANFAPAIRGTDDAIWKRLLPIQCNRRVANIDRDLPDKLLREAEGIARWAVVGAIRWHNEGLGSPEGIEEARDSWRADMDFMGDFIAECCVRDENAETAASELYRTFYDWAKKQGFEHTISQTAFGKRLSDRGFEKGRDSATRRKTYRRLRLRHVGEPL